MKGKKTVYILGIPLLVIGLFMLLKFSFLSKNSQLQEYTPLVKSSSSCIACHSPMRGFSEAHAPNKITCIACHLGNNTVLDKNNAHLTMVSVPGNLSNASQTCAKCHQGIDVRVQKSIMNTMSGIIAVDKHVFGENKNLDSLFNIHHLKDKTKAESHLRNKCASCHIGNEKTHPNPITQQSRGGGCTACHLNYSEKGKIAHQKYIDSKKSHLTKIHPSLSLNITDNHCFGCHSRSGRIATNYMGWHETIFKDTLRNNPNYWVLDDRRVFEKKQADIHNTKGMSCIDCHDSFDVMGDGNTYAHQENAVHVKCTDCHFTAKAKTVQFRLLSQADKRIVKLRKMDTTSRFLGSENNERTLLNVIQKNHQNYLITKQDSKKLPLKMPSSNCTKNAHQKLACSTCHTSWAPQCISCHTSFDAKNDGYDLLAKQWKMGVWKETGSDFLAEFPTLGVVLKDGKETIKTFAPGMIMHLQKNEKETDFHRLFAPVSAHTISKKATSCKTCHQNPVALGYGRGQLTFNVNTNKWHFKATYQKQKDALPKDAWIAFMNADNKAKATRSNVRAFSLKEQQKILQVGTCLTCHKDNSEVAQRMLNDFEKAKQDKKNSCLTFNPVSNVSKINKKENTF